MGFRINTNVDALNAYYALEKVNRQTTQSQIRLASGRRINQVADDTSGFNVGKSLEGRIAIIKGTQNNVSAAKDLLATSEGSLLGVQDLLIKIEGKLADATNPTADRTSIANDIVALANEIQSTLETSKFNNTALLTGGSTTDAAKGFVFQVGPSFSDKLTLDFAASVLSAGGTIGATNFNSALSRLQGSTLNKMTDATELTSLQNELSTLKSAVSTSLGNIGNFVQRLDVKSETLNVGLANAQSSFSRLFDADMALEQLNSTRGSILQQAATAMVSQLNQAPGQVLSLFQ